MTLLIVLFELLICNISRSLAVISCAVTNLIVDYIKEIKEVITSGTYLTIFRLFLFAIFCDIIYIFSLSFHFSLDVGDKLKYFHTIGWA